MGKVLCPTHGAIIGLLSCPEISAAAWAGSPAPGITKLAVDDSGHAPGANIIFLVCSKCVAQYHFELDGQIPWDRFWSQVEMPELVPACPLCLGIEPEPG